MTKDNYLPTADWYAEWAMQKQTNINMKKTILSKVGDDNEFCLSKRSKVIYRLIKKEKNGYVFTSTSSGKSFTRPGKTVVYV